MICYEKNKKKLVDDITLVLQNRNLLKINEMTTKTISILLSTHL